MSQDLCICFSQPEVKKITELFTRMFYDPNPKVFAVFLETLPHFVTTHAADVPSDWLYTCLTRLIEKTSADLLKSVMERIKIALKAVRQVNNSSPVMCV
jgi:CLIP-associating protein 1/2